MPPGINADQELILTTARSLVVKTKLSYDPPLIVSSTPSSFGGAGETLVLAGTSFGNDKAGMSVRGKIVFEQDVDLDNFEDYIALWPLEDLD